MRRFCLTLAVVAFVASTVQAQRQPRQPGGGGRGGFGGPLQYLSNKSVVEELKLTDEQKKKVEEATKANRDDREKMWKDAGITFQNMREKTEEVQKISKQLSEKSNKAIGEILTTDQAKRFKQVRFQIMGSRALSTEEVQKELKMTEEQTKKIKDIGEETTKETRKLFEGLGRNDREKFQEAQKKVAELVKESEGKIAGTLTTDQKKSWKEMQGEKFEYKPDMGGRPGGGQPRRPRTDL
jgi:Spy/CpxP family protein refolding chaperone/uncharacterized protein YukE